MKALVIYDTVYGNTEKIAQAIASGFSPPDEVKVARASSANSVDIKYFQVLIVGSPTQGGRPTETIQHFLAEIPAKGLEGIGVAAFDTRFSEKEVGGVTRFVMKVFKYPAPRIVELMTGKGGRLLAPPEGFFVKGKEGPLLDGEMERATNWAKTLKSK